MLGIYERIITAINRISLKTVIIFSGVLTFRKNSFKNFVSEFNAIDGPFLSRLLIGALAAVFLFATALSLLLENFHEPTFGFFSGLVLVSAVTPYSLIKKKTIPVFAAIIISAAAIIAVSEIFTGEREIQKFETFHAEEQLSDGSLKAQTVPTAPYSGRYAVIIASGAAAISAMILPGVSGSLILIISGVYFDILAAVATFNLPVLTLFASGCIAGLFLFTKIIAWLLNRFYDLTMGALLGLVIGSLWIIWPFKETVQIGEKTIYLSNSLPASLGTNELLTIAAFLAGAVFIIILLRLEKKFA